MNNNNNNLILKNFRKMEHMTIEHTFFIPDIEYLVDLKGFMNYLAEKIAIGNTCIYCKKAFNTLEATRKHIVNIPLYAIIYINIYENQENKAKQNKKKKKKINR